MRWSLSHLPHGTYTVWALFTTSGSRSLATPFVVGDTFGREHSVIVNQQRLGTGPTNAVSLGQFVLGSDDSLDLAPAFVEIRTEGTTGKVIADSITVQCAGPAGSASPTRAPTSTPTTTGGVCGAGQTVVIDSEDVASGVALDGRFVVQTGGRRGQFLGRSFFHDGNTGQGSKSATFPISLPVPGQYQVFITYTATASRATNTRVSVASADGLSVSSVNQQVAGTGPFQGALVGTFNFAASGGTVTISNTGANGKIIVDAVVLVCV